MADFLSTDYVYELRLRGAHSLMNQEFDMVTNWKVIDIPAGGTVKTTFDLASDFREQWRTSMRPRFATQFRISLYEVRQIVGRAPNPRLPGTNKLTYRDLVVLAGDNATDAGSNVGDTMPAAVSIRVLRRVPLVGRENYGVLRVGPVQEADFDADTMSPANIVAWNNALDWLRIGFTTSGAGGEKVRPILFHKKSYLTAPVLPLFPSANSVVVSDMLIGTHAGTQRTRRQPSGRLGF